MYIPSQHGVPTRGAPISLHKPKTVYQFMWFVIMYVSNLLYTVTVKLVPRIQSIVMYVCTVTSCEDSAVLHK